MRLLNKDNILEQVEYINKILRGKKKGFTRIATEDFNITSEELLNQLKSFGYSKVKNQFVLQDEGESVLQVNIVDEGQSVGQDVVHNKTDVIVLPKKDNVVPLEKENYQKLMSNFDILMEMIDKYKKSNEIPMSDIVVQLPYESDKNYKTSIRIHKEVFEEFKLFCSKHKEFSQKELISMALVEYMDKYKKWQKI